MILLALTDPMEYGPMVLDYLSGRTEDPKADVRAEPLKLAMASRAVGDFARAERFMEINLAYCRSNGILGWLGFGLQVQAWNKIVRNDWRTAESLASECVRLGTEAGPENWVGAANLASATIAAYRGDVDTADRLIVEGATVYRSPGPDPHLALVQWPRGAAALASGRYEEAYQALSRIFDPSDLPYHFHIRNWVLVDLVEAAVLSGHEAEAGPVVRELEQIGAKSRSPQLLAALRYARAALSSDDDEAVFQITPDLAHWPFTRARLQLAHGIWLRRQRRAADSRTPLRAARDTFDALGAVPWGERARQELRASGETSRRRAYDLIDALSPQELQIARLAADGLSNKEIGQQLFLSHRTIGSHLYRIFPKLGITARAHLRDALGGLPARAARDPGP
jgi:ATP/maltotriose-dependent transcriptional regulator MalT